LLKLQDFAGAARAFTAYLERGGKPDTDVYRGRGQARVRLGDFAGAVQDYTLGLALQPDADLFHHRGWAYYFCDAWRLALADFEEALRREPEGVEARVGRGLARVALGHYREAAADAEESLRRRPREPEMVLNVACVFAQAVGKV